MSIQRQSIIVDGQRFNYSISPEQIASVVAKVGSYSFAEMTRRFDDIHAAQPAVLGAAVQLPSLGVDLKIVDHALHVVLLLFEIFSEHVPTIQKITPDAVQKAFDDIESMLRFYDGESDADAHRLQKIWMSNHREHAVLAFVIGTLNAELSAPTREQDLVRNCCLAMTNAYLFAYDATQE
ncbi:hypothetical protein BH11PLA2_BH11PLA2_23470 [soil metagenome]